MASSNVAGIHSIKNSLQQYLTARRVQMLELTVFLDHDEPFIGKSVAPTCRPRGSGTSQVIAELVLSVPIPNTTELKSSIHSIKNSLQQYLTARRVQMLELTVFLDHDEPFMRFRHVAGDS
jgi:hypothetical protein